MQTNQQAVADGETTSVASDSAHGSTFQFTSSHGKSSQDENGTFSNESQHSHDHNDSDTHGSFTLNSPAKSNSWHSSSFSNGSNSSDNLTVDTTPSSSGGAGETAQPADDQVTYAHAVVTFGSVSGSTTKTNYSLTNASYSHDDTPSNGGQSTQSDSPYSRTIHEHTSSHSYHTGTRTTNSWQRISSDSDNSADDDDTDSGDVTSKTAQSIVVVGQMGQKQFSSFSATYHETGELRSNDTGTYTLHDHSQDSNLDLSAAGYDSRQLATTSASPGQAATSNTLTTYHVAATEQEGEDGGEALPAGSYYDKQHSSTSFTYKTADGEFDGGSGTFYLSSHDNTSSLLVDAGHDSQTRTSQDIDGDVAALNDRTVPAADEGSGGEGEGSGTRLALDTNKFGMSYSSTLNANPHSSNSSEQSSHTHDSSTADSTRVASSTYNSTDEQLTATDHSPVVYIVSNEQSKFGDLDSITSNTPTQDTDDNTPLSNSDDTGHAKLTQTDADAGTTDDDQFQIEVNDDSLTGSDIKTTDGQYSDKYSHTRGGTDDDQNHSTGATPDTADSSNDSYHDSGTFTARAFTGTGTLSFSITDSTQNGTYGSHTHTSDHMTAGTPAVGQPSSTTSTHDSSYTVSDQSFKKTIDGQVEHNESDDTTKGTKSSDGNKQFPADHTSSNTDSAGTNHHATTSATASSSSTSHDTYSQHNSTDSDSGTLVHSAHTDSSNYVVRAGHTDGTTLHSTTDSQGRGSHSSDTHHSSHNASTKTTTGDSNTGGGKSGTKDGEPVNTVTSKATDFESYSNTGSTSGGGHGSLQTVSSWTSSESGSGSEQGRESYSLNDPDNVTTTGSGSGKFNSTTTGHSFNATFPFQPGGTFTTTTSANATYNSGSDWSWTGDTVHDLKQEELIFGPLGYSSSGNWQTVSSSTSLSYDGGSPVQGAPGGGGSPSGGAGGGGGGGPSGFDYIGVTGAAQGGGAYATQVDSLLVAKSPDYTAPLDTPVELGGEAGGSFDDGPGTTQAQQHDLANGTSAPNEFANNGHASSDPAGLLADDTSEQKQQEQDADGGGGDTPDAEGPMHPDADGEGGNGSGGNGGGNSSGGGVALPGNQTKAPAMPVTEQSNTVAGLNWDATFKAFMEEYGEEGAALMLWATQRGWKVETGTYGWVSLRHDWWTDDAQRILYVGNTDYGGTSYRTPENAAAQVMEGLRSIFAQAEQDKEMDLMIGEDYGQQPTYIQNYRVYSAGLLNSVFAGVKRMENAWQGETVTGRDLSPGERVITGTIGTLEMVLVVAPVGKLAAAPLNAAAKELGASAGGAVLSRMLTADLLFNVSTKLSAKFAQTAAGRAFQKAYATVYNSKLNPAIYGEKQLVGAEAAAAERAAAGEAKAVAGTAPSNFPHTIEIGGAIAENIAVEGTTLSMRVTLTQKLPVSFVKEIKALAARTGATSIKVDTGLVVNQKLLAELEAAAANGTKAFGGTVRAVHPGAVYEITIPVAK